MRAPALVALAALAALASGSTPGEAPCDGPGDACITPEAGPDDEHDGPSVLQVRAGQSEIASAGAPYDYVTHRNDLDQVLGDYAHAPSFERIKNFRCDPAEGECRLTDASSRGCPMFKRPLKKPVKIFPGGKTQCLDGSDFFFEATPNNERKLHIHFQGGGACWDWLSYKIGACYNQSFPNPPTGIFDLSEPLNPLKDYSLIVIQYCGGDMHAGDAWQPWGKGGAKVRQAGFFNADAAIRYALGQFPKLQNLVISGSSAGSLGVQYWSGKLIDLFADRKPDVAVVADSFLGVLWPPSMVQTSETWLMRKYNMCNPAVLSKPQLLKCHSGKLLLQELFAESMESHRDVRYSAINSKADAVQIGFEKAFELTAEFNLLGFLLTDGQFYKSASLILESYLKHPNFYSYLVQGSAHTYFPDDYLYLASPGSYNNSIGAPSLIDWVTDFLSPSEEAARSVCLGPEKYICALTPVGRNETDYCAKGINNVQ